MVHLPAMDISPDPSPLRRIRKARGLVQMRLAVMANVSLTMITSIELHGYIPGIDIQRRLATVLEVPIDILFPTQTDIERSMC